MNKEFICLKVVDLTHKVAQFLQDAKGKLSNEMIASKGKNDLVTYFDKTSEKMIVDGLSEILPSAGFMAEENTKVYNNEDLFWIIDPLDGTTNFIHGLPCFSISIALASKDRVLLGVVHEVNLNECFYAFGGGQAFLNGKVISVSKNDKLSDSLIATGFPYNDFSKKEVYLAFLGHLFENTHGVRRIGSAATDLAYVACGRFEAFYEYGLKPWDVAAGAFIVSEAGGKVTDFNLGENYVFGKEIIASNHLVHSDFQVALASYFK